MSEYWKSTPKYYCKYCNQWMHDNKPSRMNHDSNPKHKANIERYNKKQRDEKYFGHRNEAELQRELQEIERAARAQLQTDKQTYGGLFKSSKPAVAPPPPPLASSFRSTNQSNSRSAVSTANDESETNTASSNNNGLYSIRGQYYLEGPPNEVHFLTGVTCQIFVEDLDDWLDAVIMARKETTVPNTTVVIRTFDVQYLKPKTDEDKDSHDESDDNEDDIDIVVEEGVKSERLRMLSDENGTRLHLDGSMIDKEEEKIKPRIDSNTGMSGWQTVSVEVIDESEVERQRLERIEHERLEAETKRIEDARQQAMEKAMLAAQESSDALSSFDPYNTNVYRGVSLGTEIVHDGNVDLSEGKTIGFKKRKANVTVQSNQRLNPMISAESKYGDNDGDNEVDDKHDGHVMSTMAAFKKPTGTKRFRQKSKSDSDDD